MKSTIRLIIIFTIFIGCKKNIEIKKDEKLNKVVVESNLRKDVYGYYNTLKNGNVEKCFQYLHSINEEYLQKEFPGQNTIAVTKEQLRLAAIQLNKFKINLNAKIEFKIKKLNNKINDEHEIIYFCESNFIVSKEKNKDSIKTNTNLIAISENKGKSFKFIQADDIELCKNTLKLKYSFNTIQKIIK